MTGRPWYPFFPDAYERDAGHLTYVQDSAYRRMLDYYYKTGEPLSLDKEVIYRVCRAMRREERAAIDHCLDAYFVLGDDGYHQTRADAEIVKAGDISARRAEAANKRHANARPKADANAHAIAGDLHTHSTATATKEKNKKDTSLRSVALKEPDIEIPDWIPPEAWAGFVEMRKKIKAPLTNRGILLIIAELRKMKHSEDIGAVLDQSTMKNWRGVFAVKHEGNEHGKREKPPTAHDKFNAGAAAYIASLGGDDDQRREGALDGDADGAGIPLLAPRLLTGTGG